MTNELTQKLESLGYNPPKCDLLEWALGELPDRTDSKANRVFLCLNISINDKWCAHYTDGAGNTNRYIQKQYADTPTQAALKLLITLKEEGVL